MAITKLKLLLASSFGFIMGSVLNRILMASELTNFMRDPHVFAQQQQPHQQQQPQPPLPIPNQYQINNYNTLYDDEVNQLLKHVLVIIAAWYNPEELIYLGHSLGTIREWYLQPEIQDVTVVILTNNQQALSKAVGHKNDDWIHYHQVNLQPGENGKWMPFYHREIIEKYITLQGQVVVGTSNHTFMNRGNPERTLPLPTTYAYFEADTVANGQAIVAWARDTVHVQTHLALLENFSMPPGVMGTPHRCFWRWEYNEKKHCVAMNGQTKPLLRNGKHAQHFVTIGNRSFVFLTDGKFSGIYVVTAKHMLQYYHESGNFWKKDHYGVRYARAQQLQEVIYGGVYKEVTGDQSDNCFVPLNEAGGSLDKVAAVHHMSDKYPRMPWPFGKLCLEDLFVD